MKKIRVTKKQQFKSFLQVVQHFRDEQACREHLEQVRWNGKIQCPHCKRKKIYKFNDGRLYKCAKCKKQFTVRIGTIFEDSGLPLTKWFYAIFLFSAHKKGLSSHQLARDIGITQKSAWHMNHRIRYMMKYGTFMKPLNGIIEADETYIGGKERNKHINKRTKHTQGRSVETKTPVFGIRKRNGIVCAQTVKHVDAKTLQSILKERVAKGATVITDEWTAYNGLGKHFKSHKRINHGRKEYVKGKIHTNNIENFWSLLKRGIFGIYHHVSQKHLDRYLDEFQYRYNSRKTTDPLRFNTLLSECGGQLTYETLIANQ